MNPPGEGGVSCSLRLLLVDTDLLLCLLWMTVCILGLSPKLLKYVLQLWFTSKSACVTLKKELVCSEEEKSNNTNQSLLYLYQELNICWFLLPHWSVFW